MYVCPHSDASHMRDCVWKIKEDTLLLFNALSESMHIHIKVMQNMWL